METYITVLSPLIFETINPFWAAFEKEWIVPGQFYLYHVREHKEEFQKASQWIEEICLQYGASGKEPAIEPCVFDDENITAFITHAKDLMRKESEKGHKVIVDVTSAPWNYIPASFMLIAEENRDIIKSVIYHQLSHPQYAEIAYPLIPHTEQKLFNLLNVEALEDVNL